MAHGFDGEHRHFDAHELDLPALVFDEEARARLAQMQVHQAMAEED
jgi:hypothetical protein